MYKIKETALVSSLDPVDHVVVFSDTVFVIYFKLDVEIAKLFKTKLTNPALRLTIEIIENKG